MCCWVAIHFCWKGCRSGYIYYLVHQITPTKHEKNSSISEKKISSDKILVKCNSHSRNISNIEGESNAILKKLIRIPEWWQRCHLLAQSLKIKFWSFLTRKCKLRNPLDFLFNVIFTYHWTIGIDQKNVGGRTILLMTIRL